MMLQRVAVIAPNFVQAISFNMKSQWGKTAPSGVGQNGLGGRFTPRTVKPKIIDTL